MNFSEQDLDAIINSVEVTLAKAEKLSKDDGTQADDQSQMPAPEAAPAEQAGQEAAAPEMAAQPPQAEAGQEDQSQQAAPAAEAAPQAGEEQLENEAEQPISDEELQQIYGSLDDQELERHYSVIRDQLSQRYSQGDQSQQQPPAQAPAEQAQPEAAAPAMEAQPEDNMNKSESAVITSLQKTVAEQAQAIEMITKAFETIAKPQRKSVTNIQVMQKSEFENGGEKQLSKEEIKEKATKLSKSASLNSDERTLINRFFLQGEGQDEVQKLIHSKGGK